MADALDAAIKIGEEAVTRAIALANRERRVKWLLTGARHMIISGRPEVALKKIEAALRMIGDGDGR